MSNKCIVHGCTNGKHQGVFIGDMCSPCYNIITTGQVKPTSSFIGEMKDFKQNAIKLWNIIDDIDTFLDIAKGDYELFYKNTAQRVKERAKIFKSDGYDLINPKTGKKITDNKSNTSECNEI